MDSTVKVIDQYITDQVALYNGDTCEVIKGIPSDSIHYSVFSPPFSQLFVYTALPQDLGNCGGDGEFFTHFQFIIKELFRILKPGRNISFHAMNLPTTKSRDGFIGIRDFRGDCIRAFQAEGFVYHSEVCIWKDPVTAMQRTKALGLLHKQLRKDSAMSRQGIADYLVTMRKPGVNDEPVWHYGSEKELIEDKIESGEPVTDADREKVFTVDRWQRYASPVWMDIDQTRVLNYVEARDEKDTKHLCCLQLDVIERAIDLWSNPGDTVFTPFLGVGSEAYSALLMGRKAIGCELKQQYFSMAVKNIKAAERQLKEKTLFSDHDAP